MVGSGQNDKKHGIGAYYYKEGDRYEGAFFEGVKTGKGSYFYANGNSYIGEWLNDLKHGRGKYTYASGALAGVEYDGMWKDGVRHGRGTVTYANGTVFEGHFEVESRPPRPLCCGCACRLHCCFCEAADSVLAVSE